MDSELIAQALLFADLEPVKPLHHFTYRCVFCVLFFLIFSHVTPRMCQLRCRFLLTEESGLLGRDHNSVPSIVDYLEVIASIMK
jgi:hypothetical protein